MAEDKFSAICCQSLLTKEKACVTINSVAHSLTASSTPSHQEFERDERDERDPKQLNLIFTDQASSVIRVTTKWVTTLQNLEVLEAFGRILSTN